MDKENDRSLIKQVEVLGAINPVVDIQKQKAWLESKIESFKATFTEEFKEMTMNDRVKGLEFMSRFLEKKQNDPLILAEAIKGMTEEKVKLFLGMLRKVSIISDTKKGKGSVFG